jgi:hypothetical protein
VSKLLSPINYKNAVNMRLWSSHPNQWLRFLCSLTPLHLIAYLNNITQQFSKLTEKKTEKKIKKKNKSGDTIEEKETKVKEED